MVRTFKFRWWSCREVVVVLRGPCLLAALCTLEVFAQPLGDAGIEVPLLLQRVRDDGAAGLSSSARTVPLSFVGNTATAPERVPTEPNTEFGVWSVVSVKVGKLVAAKLVAPNARQVVLTPAPPARLRLQVKAMKTPLPLARAWFEDLLPDEQGKCAAHQSWGRWGQLALDGSTVATLEVPPGSRRCVFVQTASGEVAGTPAPTTPGTTVKTLQLADVE